MLPKKVLEALQVLTDLEDFDISFKFGNNADDRGVFQKKQPIIHTLIVEISEKEHK